MGTLLELDVNKKFPRKVKGFFTAFSLFVLYIEVSFAQPAWQNVQPNVTAFPARLELTFDLTINSTVYWVALPYHLAMTYPPATVKTWASQILPSGTIMQNGIFSFNTPGTFQTVTIQGLPITQLVTSNHNYSVILVAESSPGVFSTVYYKNVTTPPCPKIDILTGFSQPQLCVNRGATARFNVSVDPDPMVSGILKGTTWYFDWGDGTIYTYTSTADGDFPPLATRTHTYTTITDCNFVFTSTVRNPCGELRSVQYIAVVHGRDIPSDGDGELDLVDNATGAQTIQVCAGTQTTVTIRDNSTWNCQNPVLPGGYTAVPNTDPRNIEWLYGRNPAGGITNTITGLVAIATLGNAPAASGRISPVPYGPSSLSQAITIPATCQAGQYFRVYLKNWNKCNWLDPEYVDTYIDIIVIAAPPAPTAASRTICEGDPRTLTVTSAPVGTLTWYSNATLTTVVGNGASFTPSQTAPGIYNFWVTDQSLTGLQCMSQPTQVTLTIREDLNRPGPITGPANTCPGVNGLVYSVPAVPMSMPFGGAVEFVWSVPAQLTIASGQGTRQITVNVDGSSGNRNISVYLRYVNNPTCNSNSRNTTLAVYSTTHDPGTITGSGICPGGTVSISSAAAATTGAPASSGPTYSWARAPGPAFSVWTGLAGTGATFSETLPATGTYRYRRTATFGCGAPVSTTVDIPVYSTVHNPGAISGSNICAGGSVSITNSTSASTGTPASSGPTYSWDRATGPGFGTWTSLSGTGATFSQTVSTPGVYRYRRTATFGCGSPVSTTVDVTVFSTTHDPGTIAGSNICPGSTVSITSTAAATTGTPASTGPTYSWRRAPGPGFSSWTNLAGSGATFSETMSVPGTYRYQRRAAFGCGSTVTASVDVQVYSTTHNAGAISGANACAGGTVTISSTTAASTGTPASSGPTYSWERAPGPGFSSWTARPGTGSSLSETVASPGTYRYRRTATFGCGTPVSTTTDVTVYSTTHNAGAITGSPICEGGTVNISSTTAASTGTPASSGPGYSWDRAPGPGFSVWTPLTGSGATFSETMATAGTYRYRRTATYGCGTPVSATTDVAVNPLPSPVISGPDNVCQHPTNTINYSTPNVPGNTYSWSVTLGTISGPSTGNSVNIIWNTPGAGTLRVTETITATGCSRITPAYSVTVNPGPPSTAPSYVSGASNICRNGTLNLDVSNVATAVQYIWDYSWVAGTNNATTATSQISIDLTGLAPGSYSVTVAGSNGCGTGPWMTPAHNFNINDIPDLAPLDNTVCSDVASAITFSISNAGPTITGLTYNITSINMNGLTASAGSPANGTGLAAGVISDDAYTNKTAANVNVVYAVIPVSSQGCSGNQENVTLTVRPEPVLASLSTAKCSDEALAFNLSVAAGSSAAASYNITAINANGLTASAGSPAPGSLLPASSIADDAWRNTSNAPVNVVYSVVPVGTNGCTGDTYTMTITVNPEPSLASLDATRCSDEPLGFNLAVAAGSVAASTYNITAINANGLTASAGAPATGTGLPANVISNDAWTNTTLNPVNVIYTVVPVSAAGCQGDPRTITITVNPEPSLATLTNTVCSDSPSLITLATAAGSVAATTYNITAINNGGLTASAGSPATGNGLLASVIADDAWTNKTSGNVNVVYTVVPISASGCAGNLVDVTLTVRPEPVLANLNTTKCSDEPFGFNLSLAPGSSPAASYNITTINSNGLTASAGSPATGNSLPANVIANDAWTNTSSAPVNVVYSIVPVGTNGCPGDTYTMTVTINPEPVLASLDATLCSDEALGFSLDVASGSVAASTYNITAINANGLTASAGSPATGTGLPANVIANDAWTNTTANPVNVVYTVVPVSASGCQGNPQTVTITVNPEPVLANLNTTLCSDGALGFNLTVASGSVAGSTYNITAINSNGLTASAGSPAAGNSLPANVIADDSWTNTTPSAVNVIYTVVPVSSNGCAGNPRTITIAVNPEPVMATPGATKCSREPLGFNLNVNAGGVPAASYNITGINANGLTASAGSPATGSSLPANVIADDAWINTTSASVNVIYTVVPVSTAGCQGNPATITITVKPEPVITAGQSVTSCSGNALNFAVAMDNFTNPAGGVTFTWPAPVLNPSSPSFTGGSARSVASPANITDTFINTLGVVGTATYTITPFKDGCAGLPVTVVINVGSEPVLDPDLNDDVCSNVATGLVLREAAGSVIPTHYNITDLTVDGGLNPASGNAVIPNATAPATYLAGDVYVNKTGVDKKVTYRVQPVLAPDCFGDPVDVIITVHPEPVVVPGQTKPVCSGVPIGMEILLIPANTPAGIRFNWSAPSISDGSVQGTAGVNVEADPAGSVHINDAINNYGSAPLTATYMVTPVSPDGCTGETVPVIITINPEPMPKPISGRADLCVGDNPVVYTVTPAAGSSFHWTVDPAVGTKTFDFNTNAIMITAASSAGTGNISVYETNSLGCSGDPFDLEVEVWEHPAPEDIIGDNPVCAYSTHTYSVTGRAGSVYNWTLPGGAAVIGDPSASMITVVFGNVGGTILVRETNIAGCVTNHHPFSVTVNPLPTANITNGGTMCDGGTRPLNVALTGTAPFDFTYAINGVNQPPVSTSSNSYTINATLAGTYSIVTVSDASGCSNNGSGSAVITYFPKPTGIISGNAEMCRGGSTTLTMTFTGVAPFTFTYTDGSLPVTVTGHPSGVYTVNVSPVSNTTYTLTSLTDFNNCSGTLSGSAVINVNQPPSLTLTGTNLICYNVPTGAVDMTITGGTTPFGIAWTGPSGFTSPSEDISGLNEGYYAVSVTDSKGCTATASITLTQPPVLNASLASTSVTCFGANDGTITISGATGGTGNFEYSINGGTSWAGAGTFSGLAPGTYNVRMRDAVNPGCILILNPALVITQPAQLAAAFAKTDVTCFGANNGTITITNPTGGYGSYQYTINGGTTWVGSGNFTGLAPGTYNVRIRDAVNTTCVQVLNPALVVTGPPVLTATINRTNITCFGSADGTITVTGASGGHGTYEYTINGGGSWQSANSYTSLTPGTYNVQIRDAAYPTCYIVLNSALVLTQPSVLTATPGSTNVTCNSANDGTISITGASGGYGTYEYTINGGGNWQLANIFSNLGPGTYDVRIRDAANPACFIILNAGLQITEPAALSAMVVDTDISCFGAANGVITITNSAGGYGTFQYSINGGGTWQDSPVFSPLAAGVYDVRIRDRAHTGCMAILPPVTITEPAALSAVASGTNITCYGANDGTIIISAAAGGYGTYAYSINGGSSWQGSGTFTGLTTGTYNVRMRDALNPSCVIILNPALVITEPGQLAGTVGKTNVTCFGAADGTISITGVSGGYGTYEYTINGGATWLATSSFAGLNPGFYNVKIRDAVQPMCVVTLNASLNITEPPVLSANVARTNVSCNGANDGSITVTNPLGGYGTYQYSINGGGAWQVSGTFTNLAPATYNVQIRDAAQPACIVTLNGSLVITEPAPLAATAGKTDVSCFGANNGIITISNPAGGYGTYEYTINGGTNWSSVGNFTGLAPGTYDVRMRDAAHPGCYIILNPALAITQPTVLHADVATINVTCFGATDGSISITNPTGGYGTYEYTVNGGGAWQASGSFTGLGPGTYNVQIRDAAHPGCIIVLNNALLITQPAILKATVTPTMVTCNGANDGIISITAPSGGSGTYGYSVDGGASWQASGNFNGLAQDTYDVRIRDAANPACEIILNPGLAITEPAILSAVVSSTNVTCNGANDGTISITSPSGGYGTYEYSVNGGGSWQPAGNFSNLAPGTYDVRIRDRAHTGCVVILSPVTLTQPAQLAATVVGTDVTCNGANDGVISINNPTGGYGTYQYTINGGASWSTTGTFSNLTPGTYNVRIRDAAHIACEIILDPALAITQPAKLAATVASTNVTCYSANDGTITITNPTGGYGIYEYSVDGGANWQASGSFASLAPGFYNVQIRDAAHVTCIVILNGSLRITEPSVLSANVSSYNVTCNGANDGRIVISGPTGGYGTYEYSVTGGASWQASGTFTGLVPGNYNVQIRDAAHITCVIVLNPALVITQPGPLTATVSKTDVTCFSANNGTISITAASGGYGTYEYSINGGTTWSGLNNFTNLAPGTYDIRIRDALNTGCVITLDPALPVTQPAVLNAVVSGGNVTCFGGSDGSITITNPTGGYGTYEYSINGGGSWQASGVFTGLVPGNYNVRIRDAAHITCVIVLNNALQITQPAVLNAVVSATMVSCNGANDGRITITAPTGGYGTYEYSINGGTSWQASGTFTGLAPDTYDVRIRDGVNPACVITLNPALVITEPNVLNAILTSVNVTCFGANNGIISITNPTGGYGTYEYSVNGGTSWQISGTFSSLAPGTYDVRIRDRAHTGCIIVLDPALVITQPAVLSATVTPSMVTCNGANDGVISITNPTGGYGTYQYTINGGSSWTSSDTFSYLSPGTYNVRIRDAANITCEIVLDPALAITQPAKLAATVGSTNVTCNGANDGTISITSPAGGYGGYEYSIDGGATWQASGNFAALAAGFYNVQIRDAAHITCVVILNGSLRITEPPALTANVSRTNVTCYGAGNGTITISSPSGGYGTYEYSVNAGGSWQPANTFSNLAPGTYNVQIRDAAHITCITVLNPALAITEPAQLSATVAGTDVTCFGANDGTITISSPSGGYGTYQYSVSGGTTWQGFGNFTNLAPGTYDVRIRDAANTSCVQVLNPALVITQPVILSATINSTNVSCFGGNDGTISISGASGGYGTYEFSINGGGSWQTSGNFTGLTPGSYNILIRDAANRGCIIVLNNNYIITQPGILSGTVSKTDISCSGNNDGTITITSPSGGYGTYEFSINGGTTWQTSGLYTGLTPGSYDVRIRDAAHTACTSVLYPNLVITEPLPLTMWTTGDVTLDCYGDLDGMGTFYASGGTMPYTFIVLSNSTGGTVAAPGFNSQTFFSAGAGSITVQVIDANMCSAQATIHLTQPADLIPGSIAADQIICYGDSPATLTELTAPSGATGTYLYQWQQSTSASGPFINIAGASLSQYTPPAAATYTLYYRRMVSSGVCMPVYSNVVEVLVNPRPVAFLTGGETICPGQSSILRVNVLAGTGPFEVDIAGYGTETNYISGTDIVVTPLSTTIYTLTSIRDANNCVVMAPSPNLNGSATITVSDLPAITSFTPPPDVCEFSLATFRVTATGTNLTYQWYVDDGGGFDPVADGGTYYGAVTPTLQIFNSVRTMNGYVYHVVVSGCGSDVQSADAVLTVNTAPEITLHPNDSTVCLGQNAVLEADATGTNVTWRWYVNKGSGFVPSVDDSNFSGSNTRILTITNAQSSFNGWVFRAVATGICGVPVNTNFAVLRVTNPPSVTLQPAPRTICENGSTSIIGNGTGYTTLRWQVNLGGIWTDLTDNATYVGTNTQQLAILNAPATFNGNQYRLALMTGCATVWSNPAILTVNSNPVVDFSTVSPIPACGGVPVPLNGNPSGGSGTYTQHRWTGDVGPLSSYTTQSPVFNSLISGTYNINYRVTDSNGCTANSDLTVTVDSPSAQFTYDTGNGCTPLTVTFNKDMTGISRWWWDFDDGSPVDSLNANPVHTFVNSVAGSIQYYNVKLRVLSPGGCYAENTATITVFPAVDATFTPDVPVICSGNSITFTALTGATRYFWDYGDGSSGYATHSSSHLYINLTSAPVVHTVSLITTSFYNCTDVRTFDITVMPVPIPQFTADPSTQVFKPAGNPVTFTNTTNAGAWNWLWRFGDNSTSSDMNPVHNYTSTGNFNVTLVASNAFCSDSVRHSVNVVPPAPVADFDSIPSGCAPLFVNIINTSLNTEIPGTTYHWDFGDGSISTSKNPTYTYMTPGTYRIELVVNGPGGTSMKTQVVNAYASPKAYFEITPNKVFVNDERVRCFNLSQGATSFLWDFGDGDTSKVREPFHRYMEEGDFDITLWAYSENGCSDQYILSPAVTVLPVGEIRYPTVFIPNKTGPIERTDLPTGGTDVDQFFYPPIRQKVENYKLQIFNRWGVLIFESHEINVPWNGYYKGDLCQQGVYVWLVEGKYQDGKPFKMVGNVTLLH